MKNEINWNHLYCFYFVAKERSVKLAALHMELAPSTISEQVKKLEETLDEKLLKRYGKEMLLTAKGREVYSYAKSMFQAGAKLLDNVFERQLGGYPVSVGIEESLADDIVTELTSQYWDLFAPFGTVNTRSVIDLDQLVSDLQNNVIDWAISHTNVKREGIETLRVGKYRLTFYCSDVLFNSFKDPKDILRNIPLAKSSSANRLNDKLIVYLNNNDIRPSEFIESDHINYLWRLCLRGRCVLALVQDGLSDKGKMDGLRSFSFDPALDLELYALWRKKDQNLISIRKLKELILSNEEPNQYFDPQWQIEVSDVSGELLRE